MTTPLAKRHCVACAPGTPPLDAGSIDRLAHELDAGWTVAEQDGHQLLTKRFTFKGFMPAVDFVNRVAAVAEAEGHHPDLLLGWGYVTVHLWTHAAGGLTDNDFIVAARVDRAQSPKS
jgi:4a-hydroxytetrahydrobiopterin dehydratase